MNHVLPLNTVVRFCGALLVPLAMLLSCRPVLAHATTESADLALRSREWLAPDGIRHRLALQRHGDQAELRSDDASVVLPLAPEHVLAFGLVPPRLSAALGRAQQGEVDLSGPHTQGGFAPDGIDGVEPARWQPVSRHPGLPLYTPLLPQVTASSFGSEARVHLQVDRQAGLQLRCTAGQAAAGVLLQGLPDGTLLDRQAALRIRSRVQGRFGVLVSDPAALEREAPLPAGTLEASPEWRTQDLVLPEQGWDRTRWRALTLACPAGEASLEIGAMSLVLADQVPVPGTLALWVWQPRAWQDAQGGLIAHLQAAAAGQVFITVPLQDEACANAGCAVAEPARLAAFLGEAHQAGIRVWAVAGDPQAVLPGERAHWLARARAYAEFNQAQAPQYRLAGLQYDIEPYIIAGYALAAEDWNRQYLDLLHDLRLAGAGLPMDVVLPWWFGQMDQPSAPLLDQLAALADRLTIMDYRTDPALVEQAAWPFLEWAQRHGRSVLIALESGPLPDLESRRYALASRGELWLAQLGDRTAYVLFDAPVAAQPGEQVLAHRGAHLVAARRTTFYDHLDALAQTVDRLRQVFATTRAFAGVAVHGMDHAWY